MTQTQWFYISFANKKAGHLGSTVVAATGSAGALAEATSRGLNPGGEAMVVPVPPDRSDHPQLVFLRNRLANKAELLAAGGFNRGYHENADVICDDCNQDG